MAALVGFIMIALIVILLLKGKMSPIVVLTLIPTAAALVLGFGPQEVASFIKEGIGTTTSNGILFIFSVIYFGVMSDTGMFDVIVDFLVKKAGDNVVAMTVATAVIATIAHLDGTTATTVLITIPALYPVYKAMKIDSKILICLTGACMGVMNLLPWGGPVARAATVLGMDANELWHILIPIQLIGLVFNIVLAVFLGMLAVKQGAGAGKGEKVQQDLKAKEEETLRRPKLLLFNLALTIGLVAILSTGFLTSYVAFLLALSIALAVNYPSLKLQDKLIKKHAPAALIISATLFAAGAMVGIFDCYPAVFGAVYPYYLWHPGASIGIVYRDRRVFLWHYAIGNGGWGNLWRRILEHGADHGNRQEPGTDGKPTDPGDLSGDRPCQYRIERPYEIQHPLVLDD